MIKNFITIFLLIFCATCVFAAEDTETLYNNSKPYPGKLMNGLDPYQDEDNAKYAYSPYPLFRTSARLYYKKYTIDPGYYQLTPRNIGGEYYVFFKSNGKVQYIIPVVKRDFTPSSDYKRYIPEPKQTKTQKAGKKWVGFWGKVFKDSGKQPPPSSFIEISDDGTFYVLKLYFNEHCYTTVYKKVPY